jgi:hypothetical protein
LAKIYLNSHGPADVPSFLSGSIDIGSLLQERQQRLRQEERGQAVDLKSFPHRLSGHLVQRNIGWQNPSVIDQNIEAVVFSDDVLNLNTI